MPDSQKHRIGGKLIKYGLRVLLGCCVDPVLVPWVFGRGVKNEAGLSLNDV